jgi:colanic acid/amylovoran biosynthesis glycosyltransferase
MQENPRLQKTLHLVKNIDDPTLTFIRTPLEEMAGTSGWDFLAVSLFGKPHPQKFPVLYLSTGKCFLHLLRPASFLRLLGLLPYLLIRKSPRPVWLWLNIQHLARLIYLSRYIAGRGITHIHAHFGGIGEWYFPLAKLLAKPIVISYYGLDTSPGSLRMSPQSRNAQRFLVLSQVMSRELLSAGFAPERMVVHPLGIRYSELPRQKRKPVMLFAGRLVEKKAVLDAINAFAIIKAKAEDWQFDIIGDGPQKPDAEALIEKLGLAQSVHLLGTRPYAELHRRMEESSLFILPSKTAANGDREGTPTVLLDAQSHGLPIVATSHAGIPETVLPDRTAILVGEGDVAAIAAAMWKWIGSEDLREKADSLGRNYISENFLVSVRIRELKRIYESCA